MSLRVEGLDCLVLGTARPEQSPQAPGASARRGAAGGGAPGVALQIRLAPRGGALSLVCSNIAGFKSLDSEPTLTPSLSHRMGEGARRAGEGSVRDGVRAPSSRPSTFDSRLPCSHLPFRVFGGLPT